MCCRFCTTLKVAAIYGSLALSGVGLLLLIGFFVIDEVLGGLETAYLVYISLIIPIGFLILGAVVKENALLIRSLTYLFLLNQLYGFGVRLLVPTQKTSWTILQRIMALFCGIIATAIYSATLFLFARKLRKADKAAKLAEMEAAMEAKELGGGDEEGERGGGASSGGNKGTSSSIEEELRGGASKL